MFQEQISAKKDAIQKFLSKLGLNISDIHDHQMMLQAFVHKSYAADYKNKKDHNERLEFVGDGILGAIVNKLLFLSYKDFAESELTLYKIALVREENLADVARDIGLDTMLFVSKGEEKAQGRKKDVILADALEALIGFIYIDLGFSAAEKFVDKYVFSKLENIKKSPVKSYKTMLQEYIQKEYKILPDYLDIEMEKDDKGNVLLYKSEIHLSGKKQSEGVGSNKKKSQEEAAKNYCQKLDLDFKF